MKTKQRLDIEVKECERIIDEAVKGFKELSGFDVKAIVKVGGKFKLSLFKCDFH